MDVSQHQSVSILYDLAMAMAGETRPRPLATVMLQQMLLHTGCACGAVVIGGPGAVAPATRIKLCGFTRAEDVRATLDQLARWQATPGHALAGRLDLSRVGMSGHSFGAHATQAVSGQSFPPPWGRSLTDPRIAAALPLSPSAPQAGSATAAFGGVAIPWLLMTGTKDIARIGPATLASRLAVYPALPPGGKYELVLDGAEHSAFGDRDLPAAVLATLVVIGRTN